MTEESVLTVVEAAKMLRVSPDALYRSIREGTCPVPVVKVGRTMRISRLQLDRLLHGDTNQEEK